MFAVLVYQIRNDKDSGFNQSRSKTLCAILHISTLVSITIIGLYDVSRTNKA